MNFIYHNSFIIIIVKVIISLNELMQYLLIIAIFQHFIYKISKALS